MKFKALFYIWPLISINFGIANPDFPHRETKPFSKSSPKDLKTAERLGTFLRIKTIQVKNSTQNDSEFKKYQDLLKNTFPFVFKTLKVELVNGKSLLMHWKGSQANLKPVGFIMHQDVVPANPPHSVGKWKYPPFSGLFKEGFIWGRGAVDMKSFMVALLTSTEKLIRQGWSPKRSIYFIFGHDEEIGGAEGAGKIAELFRKRKIHFEWILDEGLMILHGMLPGISKPTALIGIGQKGYTTVEVSIEQEPGHSSTPPKHTSIGILAGGLKKLEDNPLPLRLTPPIKMMFKGLAPHISFPKSLIFAYPEIFGFILKRALARKVKSRSFVQTTQAITLIRGGIQENVLPSKASAKINYRILSGDSVKKVKQHIIKTLDDKRFKVEVDQKFKREASPISCVYCDPYNAIREGVSKVYPKSIVTPSLFIAGSDGFHFRDISKNIYYFTPQRFNSSTTMRIHGYNERISIDVYKEAIQFYEVLLRKL